MFGQVPQNFMTHLASEVETAFSSFPLEVFVTSWVGDPVFCVVINH